MSAQKCNRKISSVTRAAIAYAQYQNQSSLCIIQTCIEVSLTSISNISNHAYKQIKTHETKSFHEKNIASESHSERSSLLCQKQIDIMIKLITSSYEWWCRSWITIAHECEVLVSQSTIERVFKKAEYEHYSSHQKSYLIVIMKMKHLNWCRNKEFWNVILKQRWDRIIYMNETSVKLKELQSLIHVIQMKEEEWKSDCCEKIFFKYTTFMFWDSIALNWKNFCYIYQLENKKNHEVFISAFAVENLLRRSIK